jgi:GntR family transcriptional regulator, arabinose operon transcriptional repressor
MDFCIKSLDIVCILLYNMNIMINTSTQYQSKAVRLVEDFADDIRKGKYPIDASLPAENKLAESYGVSRSTIRRMISLLTDKGDLFREPHKGVWINPEGKASFKMSANKYGQYAKTQVYSIAVVWAAVPDALAVGISEGIKKYAKEHNLAFQMFVSEEGHEKVLDIFEHIEDYGIDGIIVLPYESEEYRQGLKKLNDKNFPIICVDRSISGVEVSSIEVDNAYGMYSATNNLIMKYQRPVYFFGPETNNRPQKLRYDGYCRAMVDAGFDELIEEYSINYEAVDINPEYWPVEKKWKKPFNAALEFLRKVTFPISIVCLNDYVARGIYEAASRLDLKIGNDIKIIGFDDLPMARCMNPALSSVLQPRMRIGYEAAGLLHKVLSGRIKKPMNVSLPVELIERKSS